MASHVYVFYLPEGDRNILDIQGVFRTADEAMYAAAQMYKNYKVTFRMSSKEEGPGNIIGWVEDPMNRVRFKVFILVRHVLQGGW